MCVYKIGELKAPHIQKTHTQQGKPFLCLVFSPFFSSSYQWQNFDGKSFKKQTNELKQQMKQFKGSLGFFSYNRNEPDERR